MQAWLNFYINLNRRKQPSVTDQAKPNSVDFFPSPSETLASLVPSEIVNFTRPVCDFSGATFA